jgi:dipeptidyl aminopeptidase/acylaminoacyl peptidase
VNEPSSIGDTLMASARLGLTLAPNHQTSRTSRTSPSEEDRHNVKVRLDVVAPVSRFQLYENVRREGISVRIGRNRAVFRWVLLFGGTLLHKAPAFSQALPTVQAQRHAVTVADTIRMTRPEDTRYLLRGSSQGKLAQFSQDGKHFTVVIRKGNLEQNVNEYSLLLFLSRDALHHSKPQRVLTFSSSSNRPAIQLVTWLDSDTLAFLAENPGEQQQLYTFSCASGRLERLTHHPTSLVSYAFAPTRRQLYFVAEAPIHEVWTEITRREGLSIGSRYSLVDVLAGNDAAEFLHRGVELYSQQSPSSEPNRITLNGRVTSSFSQLRLSPDGKYLLLTTSVVNIPESWSQYEDPQQRLFIRANRPDTGFASYISQFTLVDTQNGHSRPLLNAPLSAHGRPDAAWSPDSRSVIVANTYLPLDGSDSNQREIRKSNTFIVEVLIPDMTVVPITLEHLALLQWDPGTKNVLFKKTTMSSEATHEAGVSPTQEEVAYSKFQGRWTEVTVNSSQLKSNYKMDVVLDEDLDTPPRLFAVDLDTHQKSLLYDLNPQFDELTFGKVREIKFEASDGEPVKGGLYLPPDFVSGKRYPLVIQTHGWDSTRFWVEGPWASAFAAQALANKEFVVLQLEDDFKYLQTPKEAPRQMFDYEGAVDYLDRLGLIDRNHIGIIGFSRTCLAVKYSLTHSKYHFGAATIADGHDAGYFLYLAAWNAYPPVLQEDMDATNGGLPFGGSLMSWMEHSDGFHLDKVETPMRIEAYTPVTLLFGWEWFAGLSRLRKPVDLIYIPGGFHILEKPRERLVSEEGNVDWFAFWLKGEEDPAPAKVEQYARWRELRKLSWEQNLREASGLGK